ncbi:MAG: peptidylprolyl isomerase [Bacteroidota bacterium]
MRSLAPWFILLVGGLFVLFMVISDSRVLEFLGNRSQNVGSINGEDVTYQEYSNLVDRFREQQERSAGQSLDESQMDYFRDQVWDALVIQKLIDRKVEEFGIQITDDEVNTAIMGPNPPAFLKQQFTDSTGNFNRQLYDQALRDPRNKEIVLAVEDQIKRQLIQEKLQNYLFASISVSEQEALDKFIQQNTKMKADYIMLDPNRVPDADVKVTDDDVKKYYDEHLEDYKIDPSRKLKYVLFRKVPSLSDSNGVKNNLEAVASKIKTDTASFKSYVEIYSEQPYKKDTLSLSSIPVEVRDLLIKGTRGSVIGPVATTEGYVVFKLVDKVKSKNESVRASHILVKGSGNDADDLKKANDIYNEITKGADFAKTAAAKSQDFSNANKGGDLGWFGKGQMVKEFEEACYKGPVGVVQKPVKTSFGYHIIKVTGKSTEDFVIEKIVNKIQVSGSTLDKLYQDASDFSYIADKNGFESEAKLMKYDVIETPPFKDDAISLPGIGMSAALVNWAFNNSLGDISEVFRVTAGYVVVMVSDVIKAGYKEFDEVKNGARSNVTKEKKFEKLISVAKEIRTKLGDRGDKNLALTIWPNAKADTTAEFTTFGTIPGLGREFAFSEYSIKGELNKWSQPVKGKNGVYLIYPKYRTQFVQATYDIQKATIKRDIIQQKRNRYYNQWLQDLKKEADVVDNRHLFFR